MPELPEVETTRRGILPHLTRQTLTGVDVRQSRLRYPIDTNQLVVLIGEPLVAINRRAKYLLLHFARQSLILHLGMSGSLRLVAPQSEWRKHDHWQLTFGDQALRYHDPRRFGFLRISDAPHQDSHLIKLGVEPLTSEFSPDYLQAQCHRRRTAIKTLLMNQEIVVGVGNIYACEALFQAGIHPQQPANSLSRAQIEKLQLAIVDQLSRAILQGGSTLKDFVNPDGNPGYFAQTLAVYGRQDKPCLRCATSIEKVTLVGRSTFFCPKCQPKC